MATATAAKVDAMVATMLLVLPSPIKEGANASAGMRATVTIGGGRAGGGSGGARMTGALTLSLSVGNCAAKLEATAPPPSRPAKLLSVTGPISVTVIVTARPVSATELTVTPRLATPVAIISELEALRLVCDALAA
jgi:hypothetical protein